MHFSSLFVPVRGQRFPEFHAVVSSDISVLGGISQGAT